MFAEEQSNELVYIGKKESCEVPFQVMLKLKLSDLSIATSKSIEWNFNDGTPVETQKLENLADTIKHSYTQVGVYIVSATVTKEIGVDILSTTIVIGAADIPSINIVPVLTCDGKVKLSESAVNRGFQPIWSGQFFGILAIVKHLFTAVLRKTVLRLIMITQRGIRPILLSSLWLTNAIPVCYFYHKSYFATR